MDVWYSFDGEVSSVSVSGKNQAIFDALKQQLRFRITMDDILKESNGNFGFEKLDPNGLVVDLRTSPEHPLLIRPTFSEFLFSINLPFPFPFPIPIMQFEFSSQRPYGFSRRDIRGSPTN